MKPNIVSLAITGASGAAYGLRLLDCLLQYKINVYLMLSAPAQIVIAQETDLKLPGQPQDTARYFCQLYGADPDLLQVFGPKQWFSPPASGSSVADAMVVCPCTGGTLSAIATGASDNLLERAADVTIKEQRPLLLLIREMPLSVIHLENMLKLARLGVSIMPASPGLYHHPKSVEQMVDFVVARMLDQLHIPHNILPRWMDDNSHDTNTTL
ncbi:MAG TPA: UbiX family flavin prenyltransferase [Acidiferrobacteraceae bacterium]|nr:UbiX family flavin prenyltransferase [Acidiferrobacteraceae bacterium]